jgi:5-aminolevulinate synthase
MNHASMIESIRNSRAQKIIIKHNDLEGPASKLDSFAPQRPRIIAFESVYSMSGSIAPIEGITFLDKVHTVRVYGAWGAGVAEHLDFDFHQARQQSRVPVKSLTDVVFSSRYH